MSINTFGVTSDSVRRHHFPQWPAFSTKSNPTDATVTEMISECAARLCGELSLRGIQFDPAVLTNSAQPIAFAWCAATVKLDVAIRIVPSVTGLDPAQVRRWKDEFKERTAAFEKYGAKLLGDATESGDGTDDPIGVSDHITEYSLTTTDPADMSTAAMPLHKDDQL